MVEKKFLDYGIKCGAAWTKKKGRMGKIEENEVGSGRLAEEWNVSKWRCSRPGERIRK
jgi:hypothetical protein